MLNDWISSAFKLILSCLLFFDQRLIGYHELINATNSFSSQTRSETLPLAKDSSANKFMTCYGSSVADSSLATNSTCIRTPQKHASHGSVKFNTPHEKVTPTNWWFKISPIKQITSYTMDMSHCISFSSPVKSNLKTSNKRDHVKGRLNFDDTDTWMCLEAAPATADWASTSPFGSDLEVDVSDIDFLSWLKISHSQSY